MPGRKHRRGDRRAALGRRRRARHGETRGPGRTAATALAPRAPGRLGSAAAATVGQPCWRARLEAPPLRRIRCDSLAECRGRARHSGAACAKRERSPALGRLLRVLRPPGSSTLSLDGAGASALRRAGASYSYARGMRWDLGAAPGRPGRRCRARRARHESVWGLGSAAAPAVPGRKHRRGDSLGPAPARHGGDSGRTATTARPWGRSGPARGPGSLGVVPGRKRRRRAVATAVLGRDARPEAPPRRQPCRRARSEAPPRRRRRCDRGQPGLEGRRRRGRARHSGAACAQESFSGHR